MRTFFSYILFSCFFLPAHGQIQRSIDSLTAMLRAQTSPAEKIRLYGNLAEAYFLFKEDDLALQALNDQFSIADLNTDPSLMKGILADDAALNISSSASKKNIAELVELLHKEIRYAQANGQSDLQILGYGKLSAVLLKTSSVDHAFSAAIRAITQSIYAKSDSIRALAYVWLADVYTEKDEAVSASINLNIAFDMAVKGNHQALQSLIHHHLAEIYSRLDQPDEAVAEIKKSLAQNQRLRNFEGVTADYFDLARFTDNKYFIKETIRLADSLHLLKYLVNAKRLMLAWYEVVKKDTRAALTYLKEEKDIRTSYLNSGIDNYYTVIGNIYFYGGYGDSAVHYYELAGPAAKANYDQTDLRIYYGQLAAAWAMAGNPSRSIENYKKALALSQASENKTAIAQISQSLAAQYEKQHNYRESLSYMRSYLSYEDTLKALSREKDLALLGVVRETRRHEQELQQETTRQNARKNLQYSMISISIIIAFFLMLIIGSFSISKAMIRLMGFLFFISLFEFIAMLIDNLFINHTIHNQPMKLWLIKIGLVMVLVPFQHFLEHRVSKFLESRKLLAISWPSARHMWQRMKYSQQPAAEAEEEEDPSVL